MQNPRRAQLRAALAVFDEDLRVVLWSKGLARVSGFAPPTGARLASFPFVSEEKRAETERSLKQLDPRKAPLLPVHALVSGLESRPSRRPLPQN